MPAMRLPMRLSMRHLFVPALVAAALLLPLPLYLVSLAVFGLPHVLWELRFLQRRYGMRWHAGWWSALWVVLLVHAGVRSAVWLGAYSASAAQIVDLLALLLLAVIVALAPARLSWPARLAALLSAFLLFRILEQGDIVLALLLLAMAHNVTPLAMAWDLAREQPCFRGLAWRITLLFCLPIVIALAGWSAAWSPALPAMLPAALAGHWALLDSQLPAGWGEGGRTALLSAMVLAQCLHYYCVVILLPDSQQAQDGRAMMPAAWKWAAVAASLLLFAYFTLDYVAARKLYAVFSGVHAWLEWPVLAMAWFAGTGAEKRALSGAA